MTPGKITETDPYPPPPTNILLGSAHIDSNEVNRTVPRALYKDFQFLVFSFYYKLMKCQSMVYDYTSYDKLSRHAMISQNNPYETSES